MLPVPSTLVKVRRTNLLLQRRSGRRKPIEDEGDDEPRDLEDVTAQKATKVRLNTKDEDSFPRTPVPPIKTNSSLINRRRQQFARDEYTPTVNPYQKSAPLLPHGTPLPCNADNQLRALLRFSSAATDFCSSFLATVSQFHQLPTYVSQYDAADISSACSCFGVTVGCCIPTTGGFPQTSAIPTTTTAHSQSSPAQSRERSVPSQTPQTASSSPRPATEESSFSRPLEYHGPPPTSEAIITASAKGPTFVPDPIVSEATITAGVQGPASVPNPSESKKLHFIHVCARSPHVSGGRIRVNIHAQRDVYIGKCADDHSNSPWRTWK